MKENNFPLMETKLMADPNGKITIHFQLYINSNGYTLRLP